MNKDLERLQEQQNTLQARIAENKRRHLELSHRVLQVSLGIVMILVMMMTTTRTMTVLMMMMKHIKKRMLVMMI